MAHKTILSRSVRTLLSLSSLIAIPLTSMGAIYVWDANSGTTTPEDGPGSWLGTGNWFDQTDSLPNQNWTDGNDAVFGSNSGAAGTVTLGGAITANSLTFNAAASSSYTLTGSTLTISSGSITTNVSATINSILAGGAGLTKSGLSTLTLGGGSANTYTGLTIINAGGLTLSKTSGNAVSGDIQVNTGATLTLGASNQIADTGSIVDSGGTVIFAQKSETLQNLTISGSTATFGTGNNGGASTVTINGTLSMSGGALTVNSGATLSAQTVTLTGGSITIGGMLATSLIVGSGGLSMTGQTIMMNLGPATDQIILNGDVTASGANSITNGSGSASNGSIYEVALGAGAVTRTFNITSGGTMQITAVVSGEGDSLQKQGAGTLSLLGNDTFTGSAIVNGGSLLVTGTGTQGQLSGVTGLVASGAGVLQDGSPTAASNNGVTNRINSAAPLTLGGSTGRGTFTMAYAATTASQTLASLTVNQGANNINTTNAAAGTLSLAFTGASGGGYVRNTGGSVNFASPAGFTVSYTNAPTSAGLSSVSGTGSDAILEGAVLNGTDFIAAQAGNITAATYTATGTTTWTAGKNMDVTGSVMAIATTPINSLRFGTAGAFTITLADMQVVNSGILMNSAVGSNLSTITGGSLTGSAGGDLQLLQYDTAAASGLTISSTIVDNASSPTSLTKAGGGLVSIGPANTYTGQTYLNEGTLQITANGALGAPTTGAQINFDGGTLATTGTFALDNGGANRRNLVLGGGGGTLSPASGTLTADGVISGAGALTKAGAGVLLLNNPNNSYSGGTVISAGTLQLAAAGALGTGALSLSGGAFQATTTAAGVIPNPVILSGNSTISGSNAVTFDGVFTMTNSFTISNSLSGKTLLIEGNVFLSNGVTTTSKQLTIVGNGSTEIDGIIADNNAGSVIANGVTLNGAGNLVLTGANTYTGRTITAGGGALTVSQDQNFGAVPTSPVTDSIILAQTGGLLRVETGFTLNANRNIGIGQSGGTTPGTTLTGNIEVDPSQTFIVPSVIANRTVNSDGGPVGGTNTGSLNKLGAGTLVLAGQNTYSGNTTVTAGELLVTGAISAPSNPSSAVTVSNGTTLALSGTGSIGAGTLTLNSSSTLSLEVGSLSANTISLSGAATLTGNVTLALTLTADPVDGTVYTLIDGNSPLIGYSTGERFTVNGVPVNDGSTFIVSSGAFTQQFQIAYGDGSADVTLQALPEPGVFSALFGPACIMVGLSRFRRHAKL